MVEDDKRNVINSVHHILHIHINIIKFILNSLAYLCFVSVPTKSDPCTTPLYRDFFRFLRIILLGAVIFRIWLNMIISELLSFPFQKRQTTTNKNYSRAPSHRVTFVKGHVDSCKRRKKEGKANGTHILTKGPWDIRNPPTPKEKRKRGTNRNRKNKTDGPCQLLHDLPEAAKQNKDRLINSDESSARWRNIFKGPRTQQHAGYEVGVGPLLSFFSFWVWAWKEELPKQIMCQSVSRFVAPF